MQSSRREFLKSAAACAAAASFLRESKAMRADLADVWTDDAEDAKTITWPIGLRVGRKAN